MDNDTSSGGLCRDNILNVRTAYLLPIYLIHFNNDFILSAPGDTLVYQPNLLLLPMTYRWLFLLYRCDWG